MRQKLLLILKRQLEISDLFKLIILFDGDSGMLNVDTHGFTLYHLLLQ